MIHSDRELRATMERVTRFQRQPELLRRVETNPTNYQLSAAGFIAEIDRMNLDVREYLSQHPSDLPATV